MAAVPDWGYRIWRHSGAVKCSGPNCRRRPEYKAVWKSRGWPFTHYERFYCVEHARRFCRKHNVKMPEGVSPCKS